MVLFQNSQKFTNQTVIDKNLLDKYNLIDGHNNLIFLLPWMNKLFGLDEK